MTRTQLWDILVKLSLEQKQFPKIQDFATYANLPIETVHKVIQIWIGEHKLVKDGSRYIFTDNEIQKQMVVKILKPQPAVEKTPRQIAHLKYKYGRRNNNSFDIINFIRLLASGVGITLLLSSIRFTYCFNTLAMPAFWALMLSVSIVCFMAFAFTIRSYVTEKFTKNAILCLWVLGISYSVFTAVSGQFNDFRKYNATDNSTKIENTTKIYNKQLETLEKKQEELIHWRDLETQYANDPNLKVENRNHWLLIQNGVKDLEQVETEIKEVQDKILNNIETDSVSNETVYNWLSSFSNIPASVIQFIIILFPAIFIDLCSTICFTFAFGKKDN